MFVQKKQYQLVAGWLCQASEQVLWAQAGDWLAQQPGQHRLHCRVGHGEATYYRTAGNNEHTLTYGWKMVASKCDERAARNWRTGREILARGYFGGELTLPALLAHTCCHEFAHLVQNVKGWIARGSIHNAQFYRVLDRIHSAGAGEDVRRFLQSRAQSHGVELAFRAPQTLPQDHHRTTFRVGQRVTFDYRGSVIVGEVIRVNRRTVNVRPLQARRGEAYFRVSPHFLNALA